MGYARVSRRQGNPVPKCEPQQYGLDTKELMRQMRARVRRLDISGLRLHSLPPLHDYLTTLNCSGTQITELPELPRGLINLDCSDTPLTSLPELPESLQILECRNTRITVLPRLPRSIQIIAYGGSSLLILPETAVENTFRYRARWDAWWDEKEHEERAQARCAAVKEELVAAAWAPARVERWLEAGVELEAM